MRGSRCLLEAPPPTRKTAFDLVAVKAPGVTVSVDSRVPNTLVSEGLSSGSIPGLEGYRELRREHRWNGSRFDFLLEGPNGEALAEVKGCTLVEDDGLALFPDAPTERGARHVRELTTAVDGGTDAFVVVVVQRDDGRLFAPNDRTDPAFGTALRKAAEAGVTVLAMSSEVTREGVYLTTPVPVDLDTQGRSMA
jgi:sugar fermentation stimulation protein A